VAAARGEETVRESRTHFSIEDELGEVRPDQTVERIGKDGDSLAVDGWLEGDGGRTGYRFVLSPVTSGRLRFEVEVKDGSFDRVFLTYASLPDERFFGFGT
jgi:hypothetical protein